MDFSNSSLWAPNHTSRVFDVEALPELVDEIMPVLRKLQKRLQFNTIAVSGHSGLIIGALVCAKLKMPLLAVRKAEDTKCADGRRVNGTRLHDCRYLILDDLIDTGTTFKRIVTEIYKMGTKENRDRAAWAANPVSLDEGNMQPLPLPKCVGALMFCQMSNESRIEYPDPLDDTKTISVFHLNALTNGAALL